MKEGMIIKDNGRSYLVTKVYNHIFWVKTVRLIDLETKRKLMVEDNPLLVLN